MPYTVSPDPIYSEEHQFKPPTYVIEFGCDPKNREKLHKWVRKIQREINRRVRHSFVVPTDEGFDLHLFPAYRAYAFVTLDDVWKDAVTIIRRFQDVTNADRGGGDRVVHDVAAHFESVKRELMGEIPPHQKQKRRKR